MLTGQYLQQENGCALFWDRLVTIEELWKTLHELLPPYIGSQIKNVIFELQKCGKAFLEVKTLLTSTSILGLPDIYNDAGSLILATDASDLAMGTGEMIINYTGRILDSITWRRFCR